MRNTMTRLHGEVVRTINFYRSQQGGTAPRRIFLCGGGAQTALVAEFFTEKFNLPVEILNPLRGVQMDRRVNQSDAAKRAPFLIMAMFCLFAALLVAIFYFKKAEQVVHAKLAGDQTLLDDLSR